MAPYLQVGPEFHVYCAIDATGLQGEDTSPRTMAATFVSFTP